MIYNNMSAVFAKQDRWDRVLFYATKANELDPTNTKSKFRMGQAHLRTENIEIAKSLLEEVLEQNPGGNFLCVCVCVCLKSAEIRFSCIDALVKQELAKVAAANKSMDEKEKLIYRAMMSKLNEEKNNVKK